MTISGVMSDGSRSAQRRQAGRVVLVALGRCRDDRVTITGKFGRAGRALRRAGRNPAEIDKTVSTRQGDGESAEQFAQRGRALDGLGVEHAIVLFTGPCTAARLATGAAGRPLLDRIDRADRVATRRTGTGRGRLPDWLRSTVWIVGVLALLLTLVVGYLMWRCRIPPRGLVAMGGAALHQADRLGCLALLR